MSTLITGGSGFIASNLFPKLDDYLLLDIVEPKATLSNFIKKNFSENFSLSKDVKTVVHLGALSGLQNCADDPILAHDTNVLGTKNILELCRKNDAKIIFASSFAVYGYPNTYSLTKTAGEWLCHQYHETYGLDFSILRFANVYGENYHIKPMLNVVHTFIENMLNDEPLLIHGDGEQTRDFVYVQDLTDHIVELIKKPQFGTFDLCTNIQNSINTFAEIITDIGSKYDLKQSKIEHVSTPSFRKETVQLLDKYLGSCLQCQTDLKTGLKNTFDYALKYKNNLSP